MGTHFENFGANMGKDFQKFGMNMGIHFGSMAACSYPKLGQVSPPPGATSGGCERWSLEIMLQVQRDWKLYYK